MSKVLAVLLELKECSDYWSEYEVPIGIHERIDAAIAELLAQPQKNRLIEVYSDLLKSLIENDGAGLKELKAFDLETYNKLKDIFGASDLLAQPEQDATTDKPTATATAGAVMPNGVCVSNVYDAYEAGRQSAMVEQKPEQIKQKQEPVRYEYQDSDGEWQQFESKERYINNQKWGEPTRALYTAPPNRGPLSEATIAHYLERLGSNTKWDAGFLAGIEWTEKAHGIGVDDE